MKTLFSILLASFCLIGCVSTRPPVPAPSPAPVQKVVTGEIISYRTIESELRPLMSQDSDPQLILMDARYGAIPEDAMRRIIAEGFALHKFVWLEETRDCDDASIEMVVILRHLFRRDTASVPLAAPIGLIGGALIGDIPELKFVSPGHPLYHAMVICRCQGGKWLLVEVESKQVTELFGPVYEGSLELFLGIF